MATAETLYNGIELPAPWPPEVEKLTLEPMALPYLASPPEVIAIDVGRQLFVDDFLIDQTTLQRCFHLAKYHAASPVMRPDKPWETETVSHNQPAPTAMVFSDGVWFDPEDALFKMWYMGGYVVSTCYATSTDGIHWDKPDLDVHPGTNVVQRDRRDSATVWLDLEEADPSRRFKLFLTRRRGAGWAVSLHFSADGIHWSNEVAWSGSCGDRTTAFYNPFRRVWVYSVREGVSGAGRVRRYSENADVVAGLAWKSGRAPLWVGADRLDPKREDLKVQPQLYNLDAVAYESLMLGLFTIWPGQPEDRAKPNYVAVGFSRDGFHWQRPDRRPFIPVSERYGDWNWGNVQSAGGCCLVVGDELYFYVSGRAGAQGSKTSGVCTTGLAVLRRDGFASMDASDEEGVLTTRALRFSGRRLFVNLAAPSGALRVDVLDEHGLVLPSFSRDDCVPVESVDDTLVPVTWRSGDLAALAGTPVRFRFHLQRGSLYAFWVSPDESGASHGYVAAGGPGFTGPTDTAGRAP